MRFQKLVGIDFTLTEFKLKTQGQENTMVFNLKTKQLFLLRVDRI